MGVDGMLSLAGGEGSVGGDVHTFSGLGSGATLESLQAVTGSVLIAGGSSLGDVRGSLMVSTGPSLEGQSVR